MPQTKSDSTTGAAEIEARLIGTHKPPQRRALRTIAIFEGIKGLLALAAALGLLNLVHRDLHGMAMSLIDHVGLDPERRYPMLLLHYVDEVVSADMRALMIAVAVYVAVRLSEAWGLWHERPWGEWLGALSGAIYIPFEIRHLMLRPTALNVVVLAGNVAVVLFLLWHLWARRRAAVTDGSTPAGKSST